jgi:hypothetical protein
VNCSTESTVTNSNIITTDRHNSILSAGRNNILATCFVESGFLQVQNKETMAQGGICSSKVTGSVNLPWTNLIICGIIEDNGTWLRKLKVNKQ